MPDSAKPKEPKREFLFATADEARSDFTVFTEECLRDLAAKDSRCRYDESTRQLWISIGAVNFPHAPLDRFDHYVS